jgi:hypothetical protein
VFVSPSTAFAGTKSPSVDEAVAGIPCERSAVVAPDVIALASFEAGDDPAGSTAATK